MTDYAFSSMRIRIMEGRLLKQSDYQALIRAKDSSEFIRLLKDGLYEEFFRQVAEGEDFEKVLDLAEEKALNDIKDLIRDPALERFVFIDTIYHNLKTKIQAATDPDQYGPLLIDWETKNREPISVQHSSFLEDSNNRAKKIWQENKDSQELDLFLDRAYFKDLEFLANKLKSHFFKKYLQEYADFSNLLSFFRSKKQGQTKNFFAETFVAGGDISLDDMLQFWSNIPADETIKDSASLGKFIRTIRRAFSRDAGERAMNIFVERGELNVLEREKEEFIYNLALQAGKIQTGPEVIFSYKIRIENEIKNLRIIFRSKQAGLPESEIIKRLCPQQAFVNAGERRSHA